MAGILIIAEHLNGAVRDITKEAIGAARSVKDGLGGPLVVAVIGSATDAIAETLNLPGVDEIVRVPTPGDHFDPHIYEECALQLGRRHQPELILVGHTVNGMACAAAVAARLGAGFASDVLALSADENGLIATRGAYGNKVNLEVEFTGRKIVVLALRGATYPIPEGQGSAARSSFTADLSDATDMMQHTGYIEAPPSDIDISKAEFILSVGRGIQEKDNLPRFEQLAERLGFTLACSRPIVDSGWLPKPHQVGQSGKVASACKVYIALGISGAVQHLYGMKHVDTILAVNTDPEAPIFNVATYGVCADLFELAKELEAQFN
ncbi:MAG: electron transfer flavoprotein subunit alpha/FixB family protein [Hyphomicrobium sp.]|uniref:electron transfer flavoprotein subunit alpha/FixB family protein n=1 Tax=Hyphomicrobium sp. TaxID=82 RepID=UPI003D0A9D9B